MKFARIALVGAMLAQSALADCPRNNEGSIDFDRLRAVISDGAGESTSAPLFWDAENFEWSESATQSPYRLDRGDWLNIRKLGLCLEKRGRNTTMHLGLKLAAFPFTYRNLTENASYFFGAGGLEDSYNPEAFEGLMVFHFANAEAIGKGEATHVYYLVAEFFFEEGATIFDDIQLPMSVTLWRSRSKVASPSAFNSRAFNPEQDDLIADFTEGGGDDEEGEEDDGDFDGGEEEFEDFAASSSEDEFFGKVSDSVKVSQNMNNFAELTSLEADGSALVRVTTQEGSLFGEEEEEDFEEFFASAVVGDTTKGVVIDLKTGKVKQEKKQDKKQDKKQEKQKKNKKKKGRN